jgi:hypothetical protein
MDLNGNHHRVDGPVVERADGTREWYRDGLRVDAHISNRYLSDMSMFF